MIYSSLRLLCLIVFIYLGWWGFCYPFLCVFLLFFGACVLQGFPRFNGQFPCFFCVSKIFWSYTIDYWFVPIIYWYFPIRYQYNCTKKFWETAKISWETLYVGFWEEKCNTLSCGSFPPVYFCVCVCLCSVCIVWVSSASQYLSCWQDANYTIFHELFHASLL